MPRKCPSSPTVVHAPHTPRPLEDRAELVDFLDNDLNASLKFDMVLVVVFWVLSSRPTHAARTTSHV